MAVVHPNIETHTALVVFEHFGPELAFAKYLRDTLERLGVKCVFIIKKLLLQTSCRNEVAYGKSYWSCHCKAADESTIVAHFTCCWFTSGNEDLVSIREWFAKQDPLQHTDRVFELAGLQCL
eukprot:2671028-Amphidinium_carterae.1